MTDKEAWELAEAHWDWLGELLHRVYVDAMVHGIKHGQGNARAASQEGEGERKGK